MTQKVTQSVPRSPKRGPRVASRALSGAILALWRDLLVHFGFQKGPLCRPKDPLGVSWTPQGVHFGYSGRLLAQKWSSPNLKTRVLAESQEPQDLPDRPPDRRHARKGFNKKSPPELADHQNAYFCSPLLTLLIRCSGSRDLAKNGQRILKLFSW